MPDTRKHRGPAPGDEEDFGPKAWPALRAAVGDLRWLLDRDYAPASAGELVGNRYTLTRRQRNAVGRCACSQAAALRRESHRVEAAALREQELWLDGYNVLTGVEAALAGGVILHGADDCYRDLASIQGCYRQVEETLPALRLVGECTSAWGVRQCVWWLDRPVSNSGRLKQTILRLAAERAWPWQVELVNNPDKVLAEAAQIVATGDSAILDRCQHWCNLARLVIDERVPRARVVDLAAAASG